MFARLALVAVAFLAAGAASATPQTHEIIACAYAPAAPGRPFRCHGEGEGEPRYVNVRVQDLYREGWRLIATENLSNGATRYWLERPIAPEQ